MASITRRGKHWHAEVCRKRIRETATFVTKAEAAAWALQRESVLSGRMAHSGTLADALRKYADEVSRTHRGERWERIRLRLLERDALAGTPLAALSAADISAWRDRRLQRVSGASVRREMNLLSSVLETARREWQWIAVNPCRDVRKPPSPVSRKRLVSQDEIDRLTLAFGLGEGLRADTAMQRTGLAFLLALETAMRAGEIVGIATADVHLKERFVRLPRTKNGDVREVPLSTRAVEILKTLPDHVFNLDAGTRDVMFRRARDASAITNLHFHDSRAEAIARLSKKLDPFELARVVGHRDLRSILLYYNANASDLAMRLG